MKVVSLKEVTRKDVPIYYRRLFSGMAVVEFLNRQHSSRVEFTIETAPTGKTEISVNLLDKPDYPLVPILQCLKEYIKDMDRKGELP